MVSLYSFIVIELCHWFVIAMFLCFKLSFNYDLLYHVVHRQTFCVKKNKNGEHCVHVSNVISYYFMLCYVTCLQCCVLLFCCGVISCHVILSHARLCDDNSIT